MSAGLHIYQVINKESALVVLLIRDINNCLHKHQWCSTTLKLMHMHQYWTFV